MMTHILTTTSIAPSSASGRLTSRRAGTASASPPTREDGCTSGEITRTTSTTRASTRSTRAGYGRSPGASRSAPRRRGTRRDGGPPCRRTGTSPRPAARPCRGCRPCPPPLSSPITIGPGRSEAPTFLQTLCTLYRGPGHQTLRE